MPSRAQRPRLPETSQGQLRAKQAWNGGLVGKSRTPEQLAVTQTCTADVCGTPVIDRQPPAARMVRVHGAGDGAAEHWYCADRCAALARARADLRSIPMRSGGEHR